MGDRGQDNLTSSLLSPPFDPSITLLANYSHHHPCRPPVGTRYPSLAIGSLWGSRLAPGVALHAELGILWEFQTELNPRLVLFWEGIMVAGG